MPQKEGTGFLLGSVNERVVNVAKQNNVKKQDFATIALALVLSDENQVKKVVELVKLLDLKSAD